MKNITYIYFTITRFRDYKIVTNIRLLNDMSEAEPDSEYHILELGQVKFLGQFCHILLTNNFIANCLVVL